MASDAKLRIGLAQINPIVGALGDNSQKIIDYYSRSVTSGCDLVAFPELSVCGYPPEDLVLKDQFVADNISALERIAKSIGSTMAVIGFVDRDDRNGKIFNAAAVCRCGEVVGIYRKHLLPNYEVFDEQRYFSCGVEQEVFELNNILVGVTICEDIWQADGPVRAQADMGAVLNININGSPFHRGKLGQRSEMLRSRARENDCPIVYVNQVGGQDELVFDGGSMILDRDGSIIAQAAQFVEELLVYDLVVPRPSQGASQIKGSVTEPLSEIAQVHSALVLGTRDYVAKNGFSDVVIGLSGGIDSAVVAAVATQALGAGHVHGVSMPSRYSSHGSKEDARILADNLGIDLLTISIEPAFCAYLEMLRPSFVNVEEDLTEENLQSRVRGSTLMALSNKYKWMVLTTGNKSELAVGYYTLYGDSVGGYAVIKDLFKTAVYELAAYINGCGDRAVIPDSTMQKPPSAELRPNQRDDQSLPAYDLLDPILELYIEGDKTAKEIVSHGFPENVVRRIVRLVDLNEYKRRQSPLGVRVSSKAFGKDRRLPITNLYHD